MTVSFSDLAVSSLSLQAPSSSEDEGLPQCVWPSEFGITAPLRSIHAHSLSTLQENVNIVWINDQLESL